MNHKNLVWVFSCDGAWDFGITLLAKSAMEFDGLMKDFLGKFSENILYKSVFLLVNAEHFIRGSKETKVLEFEEYDEKIDLDDVDRKILSILSTNARMPYIEIAKNAKIGLDVVRYRMKKLIETKILKGFRVWLDLNKAERHLYKILVSLQNISPEKEKILLDYCKNNRNVTFILKLVGNWDMKIEFIVKNNKEFHDKVIEIRNKFQEIIRSYEPLLVLDEYKANYYPLL